MGVAFLSIVFSLLWVRFHSPIFPKLMKDPPALLRESGISLVNYPDDILIMNDSKDGIEKNLETVLKLFQGLDFIINEGKLVVIPS
jgi:hypothetical protein